MFVLINSGQPVNRACQLSQLEYLISSCTAVETKQCAACYEVYHHQPVTGKFIYM